MKNNVIIIGSGLSGPLLSTILSKNSDLQISVFERSSDPRKINKFSGRSINLALSRRGIEALKYAGVYDKHFESLLIPMYGRSIHSIDGEITFQPYGNKDEHYINSVSRLEINKALMSYAEKMGNVDIKFDMQCKQIDLLHKKLHFKNHNIDINCPVIGADGYRSIVSKNISEITNTPLDYVNIQHSYKELTIESKNGDYQLDPNSLHIWPRRDMMMIALPNLDYSFTCTLFMRSSGKNSFEDISDNQKLLTFFEQNFNDTIPLIKNLENDFFKRDIYNALSENCTVRQIIDKIKVYKKNVKIKLVKSQIMNQLSYKVSKNKLNKSGLKLNGKISKDIKNTLELIKYI